MSRSAYLDRVITHIIFKCRNCGDVQHYAHDEGERTKTDEGGNVVEKSMYELYRDYEGWATHCCNITEGVNGVQDIVGFKYGPKVEGEVEDEQ